MAGAGIAALAAGAVTFQTANASEVPADAAPRTLSVQAAGNLASTLLQAGLLVLMGTPMARVLLSCLEYVRQRDWFFAVSGLAVLVVLGITVWQATRL